MMVAGLFLFAATLVIENNISGIVNNLRPPIRTIELPEGIECGLSKFVEHDKPINTITNESIPYVIFCWDKK